MQTDRSRRARHDASVAPDEPRRVRPQNMPSSAPPKRADALRGAPKPRDVLPEQKPIGDEEEQEKKPARWKTVVLRVAAALLAALALALLYVFLLLGEPDEDSAYTQQQTEERIQMPISALEVPGESNAASLAQTFGQPVLYLYGSALPMQRARIYDTAFGGGYARRATLSYAFEDGAELRVESIRPTAAVTLLQGSGYTLDPNTLYYIAGVDAALMRNEEQLCVFGQTGAAVYAVICPKAHESELETLLKQTALIAQGA